MFGIDEKMKKKYIKGWIITAIIIILVIICTVAAKGGY